MKLEAEHQREDRFSLPAGCCTACGGSSLVTLIQLNSVPVHQNLLYTSYEAALQCPAGKITLCVCEDCGLVFNQQFDSNLLDYSEDYENSQDKSLSFAAHMSNIAESLVQRHQVGFKKILEIGCGKGSFLNLITTMSGAEGKGFDPSYTNELDGEPALTFVKDFFPGLENWWNPDLIISRHVLEHIDEPGKFMRVLRQSIPTTQRPVVYLEVPGFDWIVEHSAFWDIFYEHCNYFTSSSITRLLQSSGFRIDRIDHSFSGQYLSVEATPAEIDRTGAVTAIDEKLDHSLSAKLKRRMERLHSTILEQHREGKKIAVWGAAAKGTTFLNQLALTTKIISNVIDINPRKQSNFIAGTGQLICAPELLKSQKHDVIYIMNPNYEGEIRQQLREMDVSVDIVVI